MQLTLQLASNNSWAFAKYRRYNYPINPSSNRNIIITACSREAKLLGIKAGMHYEKAKTLIPEIKIFIIGGTNV